MTEEELVKLEEAYAPHAPPGVVGELIDEVRASWAAIQDLRQDSEAYRRAIVDAVRILYHAMHDPSRREFSWRVLGKQVADLALTDDEFQRAWEGDPMPLGVVYDAADSGASYECLDAETGERLRYVKRACPERGWYEAFDTDPNGELLIPPVLRRHWRRIRVVVR